MASEMTSRRKLTAELLDNNWGHGAAHVADNFTTLKTQNDG